MKCEYKKRNTSSKHYKTLLSKKANNENDVPLCWVDNNSVTEETASSSECWCNLAWQWKLTKLQLPSRAPDSTVFQIINIQIAHSTKTD